MICHIIYDSRHIQSSSLPRQAEASCVGSCDKSVAFSPTLVLRLDFPNASPTLVLPFLRSNSSVFAFTSCGSKFYSVLAPEIAVLAFVVCGGILFELLELVPALWTFIMGILSRLGIVSKSSKVFPTLAQSEALVE